MSRPLGAMVGPEVVRRRSVRWVARRSDSTSSLLPFLLWIKIGFPRGGEVEAFVYGSQQGNNKTNIIQSKIGVVETRLPDLREDLMLGLMCVYVEMFGGDKMGAEGRMWEWWISYVGDDEDKPDVGMAGQVQGQRGMLMRSPEVERQGRSSVNR